MREAGGSELCAINVAGEIVQVDLRACALQAELFVQFQHDPAHAQQHKQLSEFPGGASLFRSVLAFFVAAAHASDDTDQDGLQACVSCLANPVLSASTIAEYVRAAALLRSPQLLCCLARSKVCGELGSGIASALLQQVLLLTSEHEQARHLEKHVGRECFNTAMEEAYAEVVSRLCAQLEQQDLSLKVSLATGSATASLHVLKSFRLKLRDVSVTELSEHQFAVHVLRKQLARLMEVADASGIKRTPMQLPPHSLLGVALDEDVDASHRGEHGLGSDISEEVCDAVPDNALAPLAEFADYLEFSTTPPMLAAVMVRAQIVTRREHEARAMFQSIFTQSQKLQDMVVTNQIPMSLLNVVSKHSIAAIVVRRMLAMYETANHDDICELCNTVLFGDLLEYEHSSRIIFKHALMQPLLLWMRSGGVTDGAKAGAQNFVSEIAGSETSASRLRSIGAKLFSFAFVLHNGFLPKKSSAECPWDNGGFDLELLDHLPSAEDALQLARRVLLRCLWRGVISRVADTDVGASRLNLQLISRLWALGRWPRCHDDGLIAEAFAFLSACWRAVAGLPGLGDLASDRMDAKPTSPDGANFISGITLVGSCSRRAAEELLFRMFADLEIWRLPPKDLLTPWVPGQVLACHVAAQCRQLEESQATVAEETRENLEEIAELRAAIAQLTSRLEATDARSQQCMQKQADLNETLRNIQ